MNVSLKKSVQHNAQEFLGGIISPKTTLLDVCIVLFVGMLPLSSIRISIGSLSFSLISCAAVLICGVFLYTKKSQLFKNISHHKKIYGFLAITIIVAFCAALTTNTVHGWGIFVEWFLLPISSATVILQRLYESPSSTQSVTAGLFLALIGLTSSSLIFYAYNVFTYDHRLYAIMPSPNHLALLCVPLMTFCAALLLTQRRGMSKYMLPLGLLAALSIPVLLMTKSLGGALAFISALLIFYSLSNDRSAKYLKAKKSIGAAVVIMSLIIASLAIYQKLGSISADIERSSLASRVTIWEVSIDMIRHSPLIGIGLGNFQEEYLLLQRYNEPYLEWAVPLPHNTALAFWLYLGVGGIAIFLVILFRVFHVYTTASLEQKQKMLPYMVAFAAIIIHGLVDTAFFRQDLAILFCTVVAVIISQGSQKSSH